MARVLAKLPTIAASATKLDHPGDLPARRGQPFSVFRHICRPDHAGSRSRAPRGDRPEAARPARALAAASDIRSRGARRAPP